MTGIGTVNVEDLHFASDSDVYYKVDLSSIDWDKSYVYYVVDASSNKVAMLTKEFFGATVNKQGIVVYPAVADGYDYTKGFVAQLTHDGTTTSVSGNVHGGSLSVTDMDDATVVYTDGRSAVPDAVYFDSDGNILKSKPALGTFNDYTVEALTVTSDVKTHGAVKLGTQIWLAEDYKTTKLSDGTSLNAYSAGDAMWDSSTTDKIVAIYTADTKSAYLYNAYALGYVTGATTLDDSNFAPQGWRLPTRAEYKDDMLGFCDNVYDYLKYRSLFGAELGYKSQGSSGKVKISQLAYTNSWTSTINEAGTKLYMCGLKTDGSVTDSPQNFTPTFGVRLIKE